MQTFNIKEQLLRISDQERAEISEHFFKTKKGEYAEGDHFIGIKVPYIRTIAQKNRECSREECIALLHDPIHEIRLCALLIWVEQYKKGTEDEKEAIYNLYLSNKQYINNWDLVDLSCKFIVGKHLENRDQHELTNLAKSNNLWDRRIAIVSTAGWIVKGKTDTTLKIATILLNDKEDLIQKAVGWMLREIERNGKPDLLRNYLETYSKKMSRTTLRYAIEHFDKEERSYWLLKK